MPNVENSETRGESEKPAGIALPDFVLRSAASSLSKSLIEDDRAPTKKEISILRKQLAEAFQAASLHLAEFPQEQSEVMKYLETSRRSLSSKGKVTQRDFIKSEESLFRAMVRIDRKIKSVKTLKRMVGIVVISSLLYIMVIGFLNYQVSLGYDFSLLGTPGLILAWGCLGGVAAILFHHRSVMERKWPFDLRWLWIAIRPLLGMIMGAFIYQAIVSGLIVLGSSPAQSGPQEQLMWALAFVAGFSDKIWEFLIDSVLGYSQKSKEVKEES